MRERKSSETEVVLFVVFTELGELQAVSLGGEPLPSNQGLVMVSRAGLFIQHLKVKKAIEESKSCALFLFDRKFDSCDVRGTKREPFPLPY